MSCLIRSKIRSGGFCRETLSLLGGWSITFSLDGRYGYLTGCGRSGLVFDTKTNSANVILPFIGNSLSITPDGKYGYTTTSWSYYPGASTLKIDLSAKTWIGVPSGGENYGHNVVFKPEPQKPCCCCMAGIPRTQSGMIRSTAMRALTSIAP
jgi:hypothetical protein